MNKAFERKWPLFADHIASNASIRESLQLTTTSNISNAYAQIYYRSAADNWTYSSVLGQQHAGGGNENVESPINEAVYFVQTKSNLLISGLDNPNNLRQI